MGTNAYNVSTEDTDNNEASTTGTTHAVTNNTDAETPCPVTMVEFELLTERNVTREDRSKWTCNLREFYVSRLSLRRSMRFVLLYFTLTVAFTGIILNSVTFVVFIKLWDSSCYYVYLSAISLGDSSNLACNLLIGVIRSLFPAVDALFVENTALCYLHSYAVDFCSLLPVWLVCVATGNTLMTVLFPFHSMKYANIMRTRQVIAATVICVGLWCTYKLATGGLEVNSSFGYGKCRNIVYPTLVLVSSILMSIVPAGISFAMNILIVLKIRRSRQERKHMSLNDVITTRGSDRRQSQMTRVVLLVSFAFVALVTPNRLLVTSAAFIEQSRDNAFEAGNITTYEYFAKIDIDNHFARQFGFMLYMLNFVNNFFIYITSDKRFCQMFKSLFCCYRFGCMGIEVNNRPANSATYITSEL